MQTDTLDNFSFPQDDFRAGCLFYSSTREAFTLTQALITPGLREGQQPPLHNPSFLRSWPSANMCHINTHTNNTTNLCHINTHANSPENNPCLFKLN